MIYKGNDKPMAPGVAISLKRLAWRHRKKLCITFMLVIAENVAFLLYPVLAGMAINAILGGQTSHAAPLWPDGSVHVVHGSRQT